MKEYPMEFKDRWFHTRSPLEEKIGLWVSNVGTNITKANYHIGPRTTSRYCIHFVLAGTASFVIDGRHYIIHQGGMFVIYPNVICEYGRVEDNPLRMLWIAVDGWHSRDLLQRIGLTPRSPYLLNVWNEKLEASCHDIFTWLAKGGRNDLALISLVYRLFDEISDQTVPEEFTTSERSLERCLEYVNTHFTEGITVEDMCAFVGVHRSYLFREFKKSVGISPKQYLQTLRMNRAKELLAGTTYTVTEIARTLGYPDLSSFTRAFKTFYGMYPSMLRQDANT